MILRKERVVNYFLLKLHFLITFYYSYSIILIIFSLIFVLKHKKVASNIS